LKKKIEWTEGRLRAFITSTLRGGMRRFPPKWEILKEACVGRKLNPLTKREGLHYRCAKCGGESPSKEVQVDHKSPVVDPIKGFVSWDIFIARLFCDKSNLQVLCTKCHKDKTAKEKIKRVKKDVEIIRQKLKEHTIENTSS